MAILPHQENGGVGGALIAGEHYQPSRQGAVVYLNAGNNIDGPLSRIEAAGGKIVMEKTFLGEKIGHIAMFIDTEGNRIGIHSPN